MKQLATLALEDGSLFEGISIGVDGSTVGEVVFNTAMTGYQEILTDPSYSRQIVTLTYPHIGNTGVNNEDAESTQVHAAGLIIRDLAMISSSWRSEESLEDYLRRNEIVAIADIDTRRLTRLLREKGAMSGCIITDDNKKKDALDLAREFPGLKGMDLAKEVTTDSRYDWAYGSWSLEKGYGLEVSAASLPYHVVAYDFGVKRNILRLMVDRGCRITVVPATTPASEVLALKPDGVFLSNGPGDPEPCDYAITAIQEILATDVPVFGICLGHQLLGLASGAKTKKMKFGHHGANHPVINLDDQTVAITSQNHGFEVDEDSMPNTLVATHRSLFDQSLQGIKRTDVQAFGFQGHPEASPGPRDIQHLFDQFIELIKNRVAS